LGSAKTGIFLQAGLDNQIIDLPGDLPRRANQLTNVEGTERSRANYAAGDVVPLSSNPREVDFAPTSATRWF
jgi:hypothetical protein